MDVIQRFKKEINRKNKGKNIWEKGEGRKFSTLN
jgi:hypothetical protein